MSPAPSHRQILQALGGLLLALFITTSFLCAAAFVLVATIQCRPFRALGPFLKAEVSASRLRTI